MPDRTARSRFLTGITYALAGSILFSGKAIIVKLAYRHGADATSLIALRMAFALPFFLATVLFIRWRDSLAGEPPPRWQRTDAWKVVLLGILGYYAASYLDFLGLKYISAGLERVILYLNPTLVLLISAWALGKAIGRRQWQALALSYAGVVIVFWHDVRLSGGQVALGGTLVFLSALAYAAYLVIGGELVRRLGSIRMTAYASIVACICCIVQSLLLDPAGLMSQTAPVYWLSLLNATACTVLPVFLVMMGIERVGSSNAALAGMVGPISTIAMAAVVLAEPLSGAQLVGTAVVLAGIFVLTRPASVKPAAVAPVTPAAPAE